MRRLLLTLLVLLPIPRESLAQDDTDRVVFGRKASDWMIVLREDKDVRKRRAALIALEAAGPQTRKGFAAVGTALREDKEMIVRKTAASVLGSLGAKAVDPDRVDRVAVTPAVDALALALRLEKDAAVREIIASSLGRIGPAAKSAVRPLSVALADPAIEVRAAAAEALGTLGADTPEAIEGLIQAMRVNKNRDGLRVRSYVVYALGRAGKQAASAVVELTPVLTEPDLTDASPADLQAQADLRRATVDALSTIGSVEAVAPLAKALEECLEVREIKVKDPMGEKIIRQARNVPLARTIVAALDKFGTERAKVLPSLLKAMQAQQDPFVRGQAMNIVGQLGTDLGQLRKPALAELRRGLADKITEVRLAAILALGALGPQVIGDELEPIRGELLLARRAPQKVISEAADAVLKNLGQ